MPTARLCRLLLLTLLVGGSARAQATFIDGFEEKLTQFETPPGVWDFIGLGYPMQSVVTDVAAVRRGTRGLRTIDNHRDAGVDTQVVLGRNISGMGSQYTRAWWRVSASSPVDARISFSMVQGNTTVSTLGELKWNPLTQEVRLVCFDRMSTFFAPGVGARVLIRVDGGTLFADPGCMNSLGGSTAVSLPQGSIVTDLFFRAATSASVDVELVPDDLVGSRQTLVVIPDDAGVDAGLDGGASDAGADAGVVDAGVTDAGVDAGGLDASVADAGGADAGVDAGGADDAGADAGAGDAGGTDAGADAGVSGDAGRPDSGAEPQVHGDYARSEERRVGKECA